jgi:hypothetical protein
MAGFFISSVKLAVSSATELTLLYIFHAVNIDFRRRLHGTVFIHLLTTSPVMQAKRWSLIPQATKCIGLQTVTLLARFPKSDLWYFWISSETLMLSAALRGRERIFFPNPFFIYLTFPIYSHWNNTRWQNFYQVFFDRGRYLPTMTRYQRTHIQWVYPHYRI